MPLACPDFGLASIPPHSSSEGRTCDLRATQPAHFVPLCLGIGSGLGSESRESQSELTRHKSQALVWAIREEGTLFWLDGGSTFPPAGGDVGDQRPHRGSLKGTSACVLEVVWALISSPCKTSYNSSVCVSFKSIFSIFGSCENVQMDRWSSFRVALRFTVTKEVFPQVS